MSVREAYLYFWRYVQFRYNTAYDKSKEASAENRLDPLRRFNRIQACDRQIDRLYDTTG